MNIKISEDDKLRCLTFAENIIRETNQYNRFNKSEKTQIQRTYIGKLAEYMFLKYLQNNGIDYEDQNMFTIYEGQHNVDTHDFVTNDGLTIDIKTASLPFHSRILIPIDQFASKKDIYIGIKLNFLNASKDNIDTCTIFGYIHRDIIETQPTLDFGEGPCKAYQLNKLEPIQDLITLFK